MADSEKARMPREQKFWLVLHWIGLFQTVYLLLTAIAGGVDVVKLIIVFSAFLAMGLAVYFGMRIARKGVTTAQFVKWTTAGRLLAVSWTLIGFLLFALPVLSALLNFEQDPDSWIGTFLSGVGAVSFLAMIGPGYADFREALAHDAS